MTRRKRRKRRKVEVKEEDEGDDWKREERIGVKNNETMEKKQYVSPPILIFPSNTESNRAVENGEEKMGK